MNLLISVQAGNSDNKLTQQEWAEFVSELGGILAVHEIGRHFFGGSEAYAPWQNVCWVCEMNPESLESLRGQLRQSRMHYRQTSVCLLVGKAEFV
jgi:hypothetical protein